MYVLPNNRYPKRMASGMATSNSTGVDLYVPTKPKPEINAVSMLINLRPIKRNFMTRIQFL